MFVEKLLGYSEEEFRQVNAFEFIHPGDQEVVREKLKRSIQTKFGWDNLVIRWRDKDGSYQCLESSAAPKFDLKGEIKTVRLDKRNNAMYYMVKTEKGIYGESINSKKILWEK